MLYTDKANIITKIKASLSSVTLKDSFQKYGISRKSMPYFAFVVTNAVLVRKIDKL